MAYLGRPGATAPLTSSDIPDGSISAVKVTADVATQAEIDLKAPLASPTFTGVVTSPSFVLTPGSAPTATVGAVYYNSTSETVYTYNGHAWMPLTDSPTGGEIVSYTSGGTTYIAHIFKSSGTFSTGTAKTVEYLVVAGGGGAGNYGGGGGGGGYRSSISGESSGGGASSESTLSLSANTAYTITVGAGGGGASSGNGTKGGDSSISGSGITTITSEGGGYGGTGGTGGSGGGMDAGSGTGAAGTANQGYAGGGGAVFGGINYYNGGGGGGAGGVGGTASQDYPNNGHGGVGKKSSASGSPVWYAGGGGGGSWGRTSNGANVGKSGLRTQVDASDDSSQPLISTEYGASIADSPPNQGGGGAGQTGEVGNGGSGIVIIRYSI